MPVLQVERLGQFERLPPVSRSVFVLGPAPANIVAQQIGRAVTS
jgi:hypothetical protein